MGPGQRRGGRRRGAGGGAFQGGGAGGVARRGPRHALRGDVAPAGDGDEDDHEQDGHQDDHLDRHGAALAVESRGGPAGALHESPRNSSMGEVMVALTRGVEPDL